MRKKRISYQISSSSSSENDDNTENPGLQVPGLTNFSMGDTAQWEERVKKLRPSEGFENTSADSPYVKPDLQGDIQKILNRSYDSKDFVKKKRLSYPKERHVTNKKRKTVPEYYHKDPGAILAFTKMDPPKQLIPDKNSSPRSPVVAASTSSSKKSQASVVANNAIHSTPTNPLKVISLGDLCKLTPIGPQSGKHVFATPRPAVKKISFEKTTEKDLSASRDIFEVIEPGNKLWDFKKTSINNWIDEAEKSQALWSPPVNIHKDLKVPHLMERVKNKLNSHKEKPKNKFNTVKTILKPYSRNQGTSKGRRTSQALKGRTTNEINNSTNETIDDTFSECKSASTYCNESFTCSEDENPYRTKGKYFPDQKEITEGEQETPELWSDSKDNKSLKSLSQSKSVNTKSSSTKSLNKEKNTFLESLDLKSNQTKKYISSNSTHSTVNIADVLQMNLEAGNAEKNSEKIGHQPSSKKMTKEEYRKQLSEEMKRLGRPERIVVTNSNIIDKEKLRRCALIWGNKNLKQDELAFLHKKFNEEALKFVNGLCANADHPGGVFTYKELQAALVKEGLIEKTAAEPYRTMFQTWTTKEQGEAKRIGLMPLSKSDDPNLFQCRNWLFPYD